MQIENFRVFQMPQAWKNIIEFATGIFLRTWLTIHYPDNIVVFRNVWSPKYCEDMVSWTCTQLSIVMCTLALIGGSGLTVKYPSCQFYYFF